MRLSMGGKHAAKTRYKPLVVRMSPLQIIFFNPPIQQTKELHQPHIHMKRKNQHPMNYIDFTSCTLPMIESKDHFQVASLTLIQLVITSKWEQRGFPWKIGQPKYWKGITPPENPNRFEIICLWGGAIEHVNICQKPHNKIQRFALDNAHSSWYLCKKIKISST